MKKSLGFIGGGRVTRILLQGLNNRKVKFRRVVVTDINTAVLEKIKDDYPFIQDEGASVAASQDIVFLSMHPNAVMDTLGLLREEFKSNAIVVSLVPNINFAKLALRLQNVNKFARVLPDANSFINAGYIPVSFSPGFPASDKDDVLDLFGHLGKSFEVADEKLENYAVFSAMLPAYFSLQWKELVDMGKEMGLTEQESIDVISDSVTASLNMMYRSGLTPEQIDDLMPMNYREDDDKTRRFYRERLIGLHRRIEPQILEKTTVPTH